MENSNSKICLVLILLSIALVSVKCSDRKRVKMFACALSGIIKDFYLKNSIEFDIIAPDIQSWKFALNVIQIIAKDLKSAPVMINFIDGLNVKQINLTKSTIVIVGSDRFYGQNEKKMVKHNIDYIKVVILLSSRKTQGFSIWSWTFNLLVILLVSCIIIVTMELSVLVK